MQDWSKRDVRQKFYKSKEWRMLRQWILSNGPLCERCIDNDRLRPATEIHHKIDIKDDPSKRLDTSNLQPLCNSCHNEISADNAINNENKFKPVATKWETLTTKIKKK